MINLIAKIVIVVTVCISMFAHSADLIKPLDSIGGFDGYVSSQYTPSFQDNDAIRIGGWGDVYIGFTRFDITSLPSTVQSVTLWYYTTNAGGSSTTVPMTIYALATPFNSSQYWLNGVSIYTASSTYVSVPTHGNWQTIDVTNYYKNWKLGTWTNNGILFYPQGNANQFNIMSSSNSAVPLNLRPFLWVSYIQQPPQSNKFMNFPLPASLYPQGAYTSNRINSVMDHRMNVAYEGPSSSEFGKILSFTGELFQATPQYPAMFQGCYSKLGNAPWSTTLSSLYKGLNGTNCTTNKAISYEGHPGFDYYAPYNTDVFVVANGRVVPTSGGCVNKNFSSSLCSRFGAVTIDHNNGYLSQYLHLGRIDVLPGQNLVAGQKIGISGDIGASGAPHLHFEVLKLRSGYINDYQHGSYTMVDPYGFNTTSGAIDFFASISGIPSVCLWKSGCTLP